ncbi:ATP-binding cassette sub-family C member 12 [Ciona intestinalis]
MTNDHAALDTYFSKVDGYESKDAPAKYRGAIKCLKPIRRPPPSKYRSPLDGGGILSVITHSWLSESIYKARGKISLTDLPGISDHDSPLQSAARMYRLYAEQQKKNGKPNAKVFFFRFLRARLIVCTLLASFYILIHTLGPAVVINLLVQHISSPSAGIGYGVGLCFAFLLCCILRAVFYNATWSVSIRSAIRSRCGICTLLFWKIANLQTLQEKSIGQMINLLVNDTHRLFEMIAYGSFVLAAPIGLVASTIYGYFVVGWTIFVGIIFFVAFVPYQLLLAKLEVHLRKKAICFTDKRVRMISEILNCIKLIKLYAWEESFMAVVGGIRKKEQSVLLKTGIIESLQNSAIAIAPAVASALTLLVHTLVGYSLTAAQAFTVIAIFLSLRIILAIMPRAINSAAVSVVTFKRFDEVLNMTEMPDYSTDTKDEKNSIELKDVFVKVMIKIKENNISEEEKMQEVVLIKEINLNVKKGRLVGVCGPIGSGKSCLISTILGQLPFQMGSIGLKGSMCFVPQQAWIFHASVRENILFGMPWKEEKFNRVIKSCCLEQDIESFPRGYETEIGERGINLSGGQKQRISLARAVYSEREIIFLDDPLSAVDAHVGRHIFFECIKKDLSDKTVLFVTHQLQYLKDCDHVVFMKDGRIVQQGNHDDLMKEEDYMNLLKKFESTSGEKNKENTKNSYSSGLTKESITSTEYEDVKKEKVEKVKTNVDDEPLVLKEEKSFGQVKFSTYKAHAAASGGYIIFIGVILIIGLFVLSTSAATWWLSAWLNEGGMIIACGNTSLLVGNNGTCTPTRDANIVTNPRIQFYQIIYGSFIVGTLLLVILRCASYAPAMLQASTTLHNKLFKVIMKCPIVFFDRNPTGRLLNRLSQDVDEMDIRLPAILQGFIQQSWMLLFYMGTIVVVFPQFLVAIVIFCVFLGILVYFYKNGVREFKRIENVCRSPWISHLTATIQGLCTIHAHNKTNDFIHRFASLFEDHSKALQAYWFSLQWITLRLEVITALSNFLVALLTVIVAAYPDALGIATSPALAGLALTFAVQLTGLLQVHVRFLVEVQALYTSVERVRDYITNCPSESTSVIAESTPPKVWPTHGKIKFENISMRYRNGLPEVLHNVSFEINSKDKVGIVGRTGSGKSSLGVVLFRLVELSEGRILIDDFDISKIGLQQLRSKMSIIPQDPVLFIGTIRYNLDPFKQHSDEEIWQALTITHIKRLISELPNKLETEVVENGENFSVGERQLLCMARAILRRSKIIMLDEATAAIDSETDTLVQDTIREAFTDCTVLTIAHRLNTVMTSDQILVMDDGEVKEFDKTSSLLSNPSSYFYKMLHMLPFDDKTSNAPNLNPQNSNTSNSNATQKDITCTSDAINYDNKAFEIE